MADTMEPVEKDRYEKRADELEDRLIERYEEEGSNIAFWSQDDVVMTREIVETFRKASKTYTKKD